MNELEKWKTRLDAMLAVVLTLAITIILLVPAKESADEQTGATSLFTLVDGDFRNPILSTPAMISVLNGATKGIAQFAGYDQFHMRAEMNGQLELLNVTRFAGDLLGMLASSWKVKGTFPKFANDDAILYISEPLWKRVFQSDPEIIGREIRIHQVVYRICGVLSAEENVVKYTDLWIPVRSRGPLSQMSSMRIVGKLSWSTDLAGAQRSIEKTFSSYLADEQDPNESTPCLIPLGEFLSMREIRPALGSSVAHSAVWSES